MYFVFPMELKSYIWMIGDKDIIPKDTLPKELRPMFKVTRREFKEFRKRYQYEPVFGVTFEDSVLYIDEKGDYKKEYSWWDDIWFLLKSRRQK